MNAWCKALLVGLAALLVLGWGTTLDLTSSAAPRTMWLGSTMARPGLDDSVHASDGAGPGDGDGPTAAVWDVTAGKHHDLMDSLRRRSIDGKTAYTATARLLRPADYVFYLEPAPYWEPVEQKMIVHYTKVVVDYLGGEEGWDQMVGFPVEIEPLVRPYGLWPATRSAGL